MTTQDVGWRKLVSLVTQQPPEVAKIKEAITEALDLYPPSRPALLDLFCDIIVDKYIHSYIHQRNSVTNDLEEVIVILFKEIHGILDKEFNCPDYVSTALKSKPSHYSGFGFNNYVCQWVLIVLLKITIKYDQILCINDIGPLNDKLRWNQVPIIMGLLDILCKTINSKMVGHEVVSSIMRHVAQNKTHLLWVVKYIGERHPCGIVDKVIDCILSEFIPQQEYSKLQSCMLMLSNLGSHHSRQLESALFVKLKGAIEESSDTVTQHKFTNYQTLIYFTLLLASRSDLIELTNAILSMISRIIGHFNPKQLEQFFLNQNFNENILRSYYHMTLNILLNSQDLEVGKVLEFLVQHSHTSISTKSLVTCCSVTFSNMCSNLINSVCTKLLIESHSSSVTKTKGLYRTMSLAVLNSILKRIDFWIQKVVKDGCCISAKLISCLILNDFNTVSEDILVAILMNDPVSCQEVSGHKVALVLFFHLLDKCEMVNHSILNKVIVRSLCAAQSLKSSHKRRFLSTIYSIIIYEARSQRRRVARTLSCNIDLLLLLTVTDKCLSTIRICVAILQRLDIATDEIFSTPMISSYNSKVDGRFKAWPIFVSARVTRCVAMMYTTLVDTFSKHDKLSIDTSTTRLLMNFFIHYIRCTDGRHNVVAVQIIFREYLRSAMIETNNRTLFKKTLRPAWFISKLVHDTPPVHSNMGQLQISHKVKCDQNKYSRIQEQHWQCLLTTLCHFHTSYDANSTSSYEVIHWVIRQSLSPSYYLPVNPDVKVIQKDLNSITTMWRRFNKVSIFWTLFQMLARGAPSTLENSSYQTLEALMMACQHLWSTSDCPKLRLIKHRSDTEIFVTDTQDKLIMNKNKYYELINSNSALHHSTACLLECLSYKMPLADELKLMLPYLSSTEVHTVLTHLAYNWNRLLHKPAAEKIMKDRIMDHDSEDVTMTEQLEDTQMKNTFSWDTLLPALVHSRIHFESLYEQFYRLLFVPLNY